MAVRVLIADDHALMREGTRAMLDRHDDIEVVGEAADGVDAVEQAGRLQPDVVLMDVAMPRLNGIDATRSIKERLPGVAVLVLSAYDDDRYVFALLEAGAAGYLLKSVGAAELVRAIRAVSQGEAVLSPSVARKVLARVRGDPGAAPPADPLTPREHEVLLLAARGLSNKAIAADLGLASRTVQLHLGNIFSKFGVASRTEAVVAGLKRGLLRLEDLE